MVFSCCGKGKKLGARSQVRGKDKEAWFTSFLQFVRLLVNTS